MFACLKPKDFLTRSRDGKTPENRPANGFEKKKKRFFARSRPHNRDFILILFYFPTEILPDSDQSSQGTDEEMDFEIAAQSKWEKVPSQLR